MSNFSKIFSNFCIQHSIFSHFSRSTRKSSSREQILQIYIKKLETFCKQFAIFFKISQNYQKFWEKTETFKIFANCLQNFCRILQNFVDFEKCWKMLSWTRKSVLIQLQTSLGKSDGSNICSQARCLLGEGKTRNASVPSLRSSAQLSALRWWKCLCVSWLSLQ